jgi:uncharacterized protein (TIGR02145 family)
MQKTLSLISILSALLLLTCEKEKPEPPAGNEITITTGSAADVEYRSASINGSLSDTYGRTVQDYGHCWDTLQNPDISKSTFSHGSIKGSKQFISQLQDLAPGKKYHVKAYFVIDDVAIYSDEKNFDTKPTGPPILTTVNITNITAISATSGGNITEDGGFPVLFRGVCWSINPNPTINDDTTDDANGSDSFISHLSDLDINTKYYIRAYAINIIDTGYGNELNFTTKDGIPKLTTSEVTNITTTSATSGGNITDDGGFPLTVCGVCWNITGSPTINDNKTTDGADTGSFINQLTGLDPSTTYNVRFYATNTNTTNYGNEITFITDFSCGLSKLYDYDGNLYNTVKIGEQCWIAENLKTTKYKNGTSIPLVTDNSLWSNLTSPGYCWYINDSATYGQTYGALYNWYTVNTNKLCPTGWHIPTDAEWTTLTNYLGGEYIAGGKLKETGTVHWNSPNTGATNEIGFTALPGGYRYLDGTFEKVGDHGGWWSASEYHYYENEAWLREISCNFSVIFSEPDDKRYGYSIRCLRD